MTIHQFQSNLNRGELDPRLAARIDTEAYYSGLSRAREVLLTPQGGTKKRPGTKFLDSHSGRDKLFRFSFNNETNYLLAFEATPATTSKMYIYKDGVLQTNISGSGNDYLATTLLSIDISGLYYIQSANTAILFTSGNSPLLLARTSDTAWTISTATLSNVPQYDFNDASSPTPVTQVQRITFANVNTSDRYKLSMDSFLTEELVWSADTTTNGERISEALQSLPNTANAGITTTLSAGIIYDITFAGDSANDYGLITATGIVTQNVAFSADSAITTPGTSRKEDVWSNTRGWPKTGVFHQNRLYLGGNTALPDTIWGSVVGDFFNFNIGKARDDEAVTMTLATDQVNEIRALLSEKKLRIFTSGGEFYCPNDVITPSNIRIDKLSNYGSREVIPVSIDGAVIFPQGEGKALIQSQVFNQYQPDTSRNIGVLAPHLLVRPIKLDISRGDDETDANYIYILNSDGTLACLNYLPSENVEGFSLWSTNGSIKSIAVVDSKLYMSVQRSIDGIDTFFIEVEEASYTVDCGIDVTSTQTPDVSHLDTETVEIVGDGAFLGEFTASSSTDVGRVVDTGYIGIPFRPTVKTMQLNTNLPNGPNLTQKKRIRRASIYFQESNGITVNGTVIRDRTLGVDQFEAPIPQTGFKRVPLRGYSLDAAVEISQNTPMQFEILSIGVEVKV